MSLKVNYRNWGNCRKKKGANHRHVPKSGIHLPFLPQSFCMNGTVKPEISTLPQATASIAAISTQPFWKDAERFRELQAGFARDFERIFPDPKAPKAVVIIPSLTLDPVILGKIDGIIHYEERLLCLLMLLRMPRTHVVYVTSMPIDPVVIDYYLHLLPGITNYHARQRLTVLSCYDLSPRSLTEKLLERPRLLERIRKAVPQGHAPHLACFNVTEWERRLAVTLDMPVYGCDPLLYPLGNKSNSRKIFRDCALLVPPGYEDLYTYGDVAKALFQLREQLPGIRKAVVKMNDGFSGEGNAIFSYGGLNDVADEEELKDHLLEHLYPVANDLTPEIFMDKLKQMGGIVEAFVEGDLKTSPSVQCRIDPLGHCEIIATHDQVLSGSEGQVFSGAYFPADTAYAETIAEQGMRVTRWLSKKGVIGRFGVDFISVLAPEGHWMHYAIEINLRKGGTTHPYLMLQFLTDGQYDAQKGIYTTANGQVRYYFASDNFHHEDFKGLTPHDLIEIAMCRGLLYDGSKQEGIMFHMMSSLSQYGKMGVVCIGASRERAQAYYDECWNVLRER